MADVKITALTAIGLNPVNPATFPMPMVDLLDNSMASSGSTRKVTVNQILGAGGTATLASATITGDLTVRTNKLLVTSTGVGVGMTPITPLSGVIGTTGAVFFRTTDPTAPVATPYIQAPVSTGFSSVSPVYGFWYQGCGIGNPALNNVSIITDSTERYKIDITGISTWSVAGTTAMTLNSTGLGLGVSPVTALSFPIGSTRVVAQSAVTAHLAGNAGTLKFGIADGGGDYAGLHVVNSHDGTYSSQDLLFFTGEGGVSSTTERMRITRSGNLILSAPNTPPTLATNGQLTVNATSNTNLRFSYRGSDGTTRVANITLA